MRESLEIVGIAVLVILSGLTCGALLGRLMRRTAPSVRIGDVQRMERRAHGDVLQPDSHGRWTPR
jgi:hypothetical protein